MENEQLVQLTADIVAAHVANNNVAVGDVGNLVQRVYEALSALEKPAEEAKQEEKTPVVSVRASIKPEYIVCMECGAKQRMLKRHLMTAHQMTPEQYRSDYGLPRDYPMVAPNYSEQRRALAHSIGLGRKKGGEEAPAPAAEPAKASGRGRGRPRKAAADA
ncbi:MucR family transcriptional regulator [Sphingosinicella sp. BN140058]|uniref:MucR family transcriptional regulator n=1 Tax=Sphingosinicella sp. BN140058 TaxID=1892855 RepID=UPI00101044D0|nr:MucR family transcriptional regulator [Sphingosinicella sp. BN140058]QAY75687.1 MucR family transcriptional regulator [Sphingosinicella sp. BN140058]